ncbi:MAG: MurR/RpiR family transcriptional regulator [Woeseiaceae bacterium]
MLAKINDSISELSRAEQRVARWVVRHPRQASRSTLASISAACDVSEPTIIRFCRHVGSEGFRDFSIQLAEELSRPVSTAHSDVHVDDTDPEAVCKVLDASIRSLTDLRSISTDIPISEAVAALKDARQIAFAGLGASGHVAADACQKFFRLGIPCCSLTNTPDLLQFASIAGPDDVLVITSHGGKWPELARAAELAVKNGATVLALTDRGSRLAEVATILFPCEVIVDRSPYMPLSSRLAHLALLDALQVVLAIRMGTDATARLQRSRKAISKP